MSVKKGKNPAVKTAETQAKSRIAEEEEKILAFWQKEDIFQKSIDKPDPYGEYVFYDGPPFATGLPHYGSILPSAIKDAVPRYQTMRGKKVLRRWGWDCHGLPIENIVEKELKISGKKEIEKMGIDTFNAKARESVLRFAGEWKKTIDRIGRWVDFDNAYMTMDNDFIESVWWALKEIHTKGLLYEGVKVLAYCPRCETPIANAEIAMDNSYKEIKDISLYVKFALKGMPNPITNLVAWTTTPWTLPANVALAVNPSAKYVVFNLRGEQGDYIVAEELLPQIAELPGVEVLEGKTIIKGKKLVGKEYEPLFNASRTTFSAEDVNKDKNSYKVYGADFVTLEEGTGVVHIAPAFGEDDKALADKKNLPLIKHVSPQGKFMGGFDGLEDQKLKFVKPKGSDREVDIAILKYLASRNLLFAKKKITHSYPHCHRCETPLYYYALPSWFINIQKVKRQLLKNNDNVNWFPAHLKYGRFGKTIESAPDWTISRNRYWASPLPIWKCEVCDAIEIIGSRKELFEKAPEWKDKLTDLHRPYIDAVMFSCTNCENSMKRIPEVVDGWVESGSMPFAANHYPFENKAFFKENFPAQFITEYIAQTRTWFYYTHTISTILFGKHAFENVLTTGTILAEDGSKMSKSKSNFPDPWLILGTYGADALRLYLLGSPVMKGEDLNFIEEGVDAMLKKVVLVTENILEFYTLFKGDVRPEGTLLFDVEHPLDKWLVALHDKTVVEVTEAMDNYDIARAVKVLEEYIRELSQWYIRRSRGRFKGDNVLDREQAISVLGEVLYSLSRMLAPLAPYIAERIYQSIFSKQGPFESVHLDDWQKPLKSGEYNDELARMEIAREIVELVFSIRGDEKIKVRQPLSEMQVTVDGKSWNITESLRNMILDEVNVRKFQTYDSLDDFDANGKKIITKNSGAVTVAVNIEISEELKREGWIRELTRQINSYRKKEGLTINDTVAFTIASDSDVLIHTIGEFKNELEKSILGTIEVGSPKGSEELSIENTKVAISYTK